MQIRKKLFSAFVMQLELTKNDEKVFAWSVVIKKPLVKAKGI